MQILYFITFCIFCLILILILFYYINTRFEREKIINYPYYEILLKSFLEKSYDIIYKDKLLIYSIEATKINDEQFYDVTKDFIKLVEKLLGKNLIASYIDLYGDIETFRFNLAEYFHNRYENDEVRKASVDNLMEKEVEVKTEENISGLLSVS